MDSIYTNMKGKNCPLKSITCQEGYCSECEIPKSIPVVEWQGLDKFGRVKQLSKEHGDMTLGILDSYFGRSYN